MKTQKSIVTVLVSLLTVVGGAVIAQQGGMGGFQMPSEEEMKEMMKAQAKESAEVSMKEYDEDEDGSLSLDEFTTMVDEAE
ncbi:MAG: EF-hand domain-containing protein, partial [Gammaproteobacteria bacterium]|nr:EF-hand domain-containing protein [Gammaproteobacteria bacterium]